MYCRAYDCVFLMPQHCFGLFKVIWFVQLLCFYVLLYLPAVPFYAGMWVLNLSAIFEISIELVCKAVQ